MSSAFSGTCSSCCSENKSFSKVQELLQSGDLGGVRSRRSQVVSVAERWAAAALCDTCVISGRFSPDTQNNYIKRIVGCINGIITQI